MEVQPGMQDLKQCLSYPDMQKKKETIDIFVNLLEDRSRDVRRGQFMHWPVTETRLIGSLDEVMFKDPALGRDIRYAKKRILNPPKKPTKTPSKRGLKKQIGSWTK